MPYTLISFNFIMPEETMKTLLPIFPPTAQVTVSQLSAWLLDVTPQELLLPLLGIEILVPTRICRAK